MNERIKLLAEQADEYTKQTVHYYQGQFNGLTWEGKIKQTRDTKFAELIVKECAEVIFKTPVEYIEIDAMHRIRDNVKSHFGVE